MEKTFLESAEFTEWIKAYLGDDLLADPDRGDVMPGCGGLRKMRIGDPRRGKGKRGGARVIDLHVEEADVIHLVTVYGKDQQDDLSAGDKRLYRQLAEILKQQGRRGMNAS